MTRAEGTVAPTSSRDQFRLALLPLRTRLFSLFPVSFLPPETINIPVGLRNILVVLRLRLCTCHNTLFLSTPPSERLPDTFCYNSQFFWPPLHVVLHGLTMVSLVETGHDVPPKPILMNTLSPPGTHG